MRRPIFGEPVVVSRISFAPAGVGVVARLVRQHGFIVVEIDLAIIVRTLTFLIHVRDPIAACATPPRVPRTNIGAE